MNSEFLANQIMAGRTRVELGNQSLYVCPPSPAQKLRASEIFEQTVRDSYLLGVLSEEEVMEYLINQGLWSHENESVLQTASIKIDGLKAEMYNNYESFRSKRVEQLKKSLQKLKDRVNELYVKKHSYDKFTCSGIATEMSVGFLVGKNVFDEEDHHINTDDFPLSSFTFLLNNYCVARISDKDIRGVSKSSYWRGVWKCGETASDIFGVPSCMLSDEQRSLISWSKLYDSVYEHPDTPDDEVVSDDDLLDGWLIIEHKKRKEDRKDKDKNKFGGKSGAQEVFVMAETEEDAKRINQMNDVSANFIKRQRMGVLKNRGAVKEENMPDSKQSMAIQASKQFRDRMKGK